MNKSIFWLIFLLNISMLGEKLFFFKLETSQLTSAWALLEILMLAALLILSFRNFLHSDFREKVTFNLSLNIRQKALIGFIALALIMSFFTNLKKETLDWDAIALYDARAQFLNGGLTFSNMSELARYDIKNGYYYLLYPPFTSLTHYVWYQAGVPITVSTLYSFFLLILTLGISLFFIKRLGITWGLLSALLVISQQTLYSTSQVAYTNLPYTLCLSLGILSLHAFLKEQKVWMLYLGAGLVANSEWVRFLEPSWLAVALAFTLSLPLSMSLKKSFKPAFTVFASAILSYFSWNYFMQEIAHKESIFSFSWIFVIDPVIGFFTGSFLTILKAYVQMWGRDIVLLIGALLPLARDFRKRPENIFFQLLVIISFCMYLAGLYFVSFQFDWWPEMGGSLLRSATFLIPISVLVVAQSVKELLKKK